MKLILTFFLAVLPFTLSANTLNNKTPVPTIEAAQRSGLYEGVSTTEGKPAQKQQEERLKREHPEEYHDKEHGQRAPTAGKP